MSAQVQPVVFGHQGCIDVPMGSVGLALTDRVERMRRDDPSAAERVDALTYVFRRPVGQTLKNEVLTIAIRPEGRSTVVSMTGSVEAGRLGGLRRSGLRYLRTQDCRALLGSVRGDALRIHRSSGPPGGTPVQEWTPADELRRRGLVPIEVRHNKGR